MRDTGEEESGESDVHPRGRGTVELSKEEEQEGERRVLNEVAVRTDGTEERTFLRTRAIDALKTETVHHNVGREVGVVAGEQSRVGKRSLRVSKNVSVRERARRGAWCQSVVCAQASREDTCHAYKTCCSRHITSSGRPRA